MSYFLRAHLYIICIIAFLSACTHHPEASLLDEAESLMADHPDSAYALLQGIDAAALPTGSELQARYALLYTRGQYKMYDDPESDSLISIAADYYEAYGSEEEKFYAYLYQGIVQNQLTKYEEASVSLTRAMHYTSSIEDAYSRGQLYGNLSISNSALHCSAAENFSAKAFHEYRKGGLDDYASSALVLLATNKLQAQDYDSCRILLDSALIMAEKASCVPVLFEGYSLLAQYAVGLDSLSLAEETFNKLVEEYNYQFDVQDCCNLAWLNACNDNLALSNYYICQARTNSRTTNDSINVIVISYWISQHMEDYEKASHFQDTLIMMEEKMLSENQLHTALAAQRDYAEWNMKMAEKRSQTKTVIVIILTLLLLSSTFAFYLSFQNHKITIKLQERNIESLKHELSLHENERQMGLQMLRNDGIIDEIKSIALQHRGLTQEEWNRLYQLFSQYLPSFETSLRNLTNLSDTEWRVCILLKISITPGDIATLTNRSPGAISSTRERLVKKVFSRKGTTSEWDAFIDSL